MLMVWPVHPHVKEDGEAIQGILVHRPCKAHMVIYSPLDHSDRRAIVAFTAEPHNHPMPPHTKLSYEAKAKYREAIQAAGTTGLTVGKCERGMDI